MIRMKEITGGFIPQGRQAARDLKAILEAETGKTTIDFQDVRAVPATFFDELLAVINEITGEQSPDVRQVRLENAPYEPRPIHGKIAGRHNFGLTQEKGAWLISAKEAP